MWFKKMIQRRQEVAKVFLGSTGATIKRAGASKAGNQGETANATALGEENLEMSVRSRRRHVAAAQSAGRIRAKAGCGSSGRALA
jgi:hypothetical protein